MIIETFPSMKLVIADEHSIDREKSDSISQGELDVIRPWEWSHRFDCFMPELTVLLLFNGLSLSHFNIE